MTTRPKLGDVVWESPRHARHIAHSTEKPCLICGPEGHTRTLCGLKIGWPPRRHGGGTSDTYVPATCRTCLCIEKQREGEQR